MFWVARSAYKTYFKVLSVQCHLHFSYASLHYTSRCRYASPILGLIGEDDVEKPALVKSLDTSSTTNSWVQNPSPNSNKSWWLLHDVPLDARTLHRRIKEIVARCNKRWSFTASSFAAPEVELMKECFLKLLPKLSFSSIIWTKNWIQEITISRLMRRGIAAVLT